LKRQERLKREEEERIAAAKREEEGGDGVNFADIFKKANPTPKPKDEKETAVRSSSA